MGDLCYMSVTCRRSDQARFEKLGFGIEYGDDDNSPVITLIDEEANYAHNDKMPADIPFTAFNGAGCDYGEAKLVCDGKETVEVPVNHHHCFCIDWNFMSGRPMVQSIQRIRRYLKLERRVNRLFTKLREENPKEHLFSPHTHCCIKCGIHADDDLVENRACTK
jgi:hypothetical protein